jgi:hypothetical protein
MDQVDPHGQRLDPGGLNRPLGEFIVVRFLGYLDPWVHAQITEPARVGAGLLITPLSPKLDHNMWYLHVCVLTTTCGLRGRKTLGDVQNSLLLVA